MDKYIRPIPGARISATYAQHTGRKPPSVEPGIDYAAAMRTPVLCPNDGVITRRGWSGDFAQNRIMVSFLDGNYGSGIHLAAYVPSTTPGSRVSRAQVIGLSGTAGTGPHLHWTFWLARDRPAGWQGPPIPGDNRWRPVDFEAFYLAQFGAPAGGGSKPFEPPKIPTETEQDMSATLVRGGGGQTLILGGKGFPLATPAQVQAIKGADLLEVDADTHYAIRQAFGAAATEGLPVVVYVPQGNGTVYILADGQLVPLVDPTTLSELAAAGAASIELSVAEAENLLKRS